MKVRCNQCMKVFDEERIVYDGEDDIEYCPECGESGCLMDIAETRYYVCGLGYNEDNEPIDYEEDFGDFDTYVEAYELFVRLQCRDRESFFENAPEVYALFIQLEECEEDDEEIRCIDIHNNWEIINPKFEEEV